MPPAAINVNNFRDFLRVGKVKKKYIRRVLLILKNEKKMCVFAFVTLIQGEIVLSRMSNFFGKHLANI